MRLIFFLSLLILSHCSQKHEENHLKTEKSSYLQQHAQQKIWWYPWNNSALNYSKKNQKLIFLSIGYSSCHWCHVMEKKVFAHDDVADKLNKYYVSIKVDREERPDLDSYFLKAQTIINKRSGWPITLILTPDLQPVFGASFVPKKEFLYILEEVNNAWVNQKDKLIERGEKVNEWLNTKPKTELSYEKDKELLQTFYNHYTHLFDPLFGGKKIGPHFAPKFPINDDLRLLLRYYFHKKEKQALKMVKLTLKTIAKSALFDHLDGGFHRYSIDRKWQTPHFEKMLYDQASFINAYIELYQINPDPLLKSTIQKTITYLLNDLQRPKGGFYSSQDADVNGQEGLYQTWQEHEIQSSLTKDEFKTFNDYFSLSPQNKNLHLRRTLFRKSSFVNLKTEHITEKLKKARRKRTLPKTDQKIITSWNGLILSSLSKVARIWPSKDLTEILKKNFDYIIKQHMRFNGELVRSSMDGHISYNGILDDYAFFIDALIEFYQTSFDEKYLLLAKTLQDKQNDLFYDKENGNFFLTTDSLSIIKNYKSFEDQTRPTGQAISYWNLLRLSHFFANEHYSKMASDLIESYPDGLKQVPHAFSSLLINLDFALSNNKELIIAGTQEDCLKASQEIFQGFFPYVIFGCNKNGSRIPLLQKKQRIENKTTYYVCEKGLCKTPTSSFSEAKKSFFTTH